MSFLRTPVGRRRDSVLDSLPMGTGLEGVARLIFHGPDQDEDALRAIVQLGQMLMENDPGNADLALFLIAWAAERIAGQRIAAGDLGIDDAERRVGELRNRAGWRQAVAEYQALADEIYIDTLNELREFAMVVLYVGQRETFSRRVATGKRLLGGLLPEPVNSDDAPLALAG